MHLPLVFLFRICVFDDVPNGKTISSFFYEMFDFYYEIFDPIST